MCANFSTALDVGQLPCLSLDFYVAINSVRLVYGITILPFTMVSTVFQSTTLFLGATVSVDPVATFNNSPGQSRGSSVASLTSSSLLVTTVHLWVPDLTNESSV